MCRRSSSSFSSSSLFVSKSISHKNREREKESGETPFNLDIRRRSHSISPRRYKSRLPVLRHCKIRSPTLRRRKKAKSRSSSFSQYLGVGRHRARSRSSSYSPIHICRKKARSKSSSFSPTSSTSRSFRVPRCWRMMNFYFLLFCGAYVLESMMNFYFSPGV